MSWLHRILGRDGASQLEVDPSHFAARMSQRPPECLGAYGFTAITGTLAAALAAGAAVFHARWTDNTNLCVVTSFRMNFLPLTPFTANTLTDHSSFCAFVARGFTADFTGGTALTVTTNSFKRRTSMPSTKFASGGLRIATTAAFGGGTVSDQAANAFSMSLRKGNRVNPAAATEETIQPTMNWGEMAFDPCTGDYPIVLADDEGIIVRNRTVWPAAGTGLLMVQMNWLEVAAY
jgi:hypothetical protein